MFRSQAMYVWSGGLGVQVLIALSCISIQKTSTQMQRTIHTLGISQKKNLKVNKDELNKKNKKIQL